MIIKRSVSIRGHATSISIEDRFWERLRILAGERGISPAALIAEVDASRQPGTNLSSAIRLYILEEALERLR